MNPLVGELQGCNSAITQFHRPVGSRRRLGAVPSPRLQDSDVRPAR